MTSVRFFPSRVVSILMVSLLAVCGCGTPGGSGVAQLTINITGSGTVTPNSGSFLAGTQISVQASPASGFRFDRWEGALAGSTNPAKLTLNIGTTTVRAFFVSLSTPTKPVAYNLTVTTPDNQTVSFDLQGFDPTSPTLTYTVLGLPAHGQISFASPTVTFAATAGFIGVDTLNYKVTDNANADSDPAKVNINVFNAGLLGWAKSFGSVEVDKIYGQALDSGGNVYVTGKYSDVVDFDPGPKNKLFQSAGGTDVFLAKFAPNGDFLWVRAIGGTDNDAGFAVAVDSLDNVCLAGTFSGTIIVDAKTGINMTSRGGTGVFVCKFTSDAVFQWVRAIDGTGDEAVFSLATDAANNIIVGGSFTGSIDFNAVEGHDERISRGARDGFVTKLTGGGQYLWTDTFGGTLDDEITGVGVDNGSNVYAGGYFSNSMDIDPGDAVETVNAAGGTDIFLVKLNSDGQKIWGKTIGGPGQDQALGLVADPAGTVAICGFFTQTVNFNAGVGLDSRTSAGDMDAFVTVFNSSGGYVFTRAYGGTGKDFLNAVAFDAAENVYAVGGFTGTVNFAFSGTPDRKSSVGLMDAFATKITTAGGYGGAATVGGTGDDVANAIVFSSGAGAAYWAGSFQKTADLDPRSVTGIGILTQIVEEDHAAFGADDCFLIKTDANLGW